MTIEFNNPEDGHAIAEKAGTYFNSVCDVSIARREKGQLLGGVIYQNFTGESIEMHVASFRKHWINKDLLWASFHYPFVQLNVNRIFAEVREANAGALEFCLGLGFKTLTKVDGVFTDGGAFMISMERDECRWLKLTPKSLQSGQEN